MAKMAQTLTAFHFTVVYVYFIYTAMVVGIADLHDMACRALSPHRKHILLGSKNLLIFLPHSRQMEPLPRQRREVLRQAAARGNEAGSGARQ